MKLLFKIFCMVFVVSVPVMFNQIYSISYFDYLPESVAKTNLEESITQDQWAEFLVNILDLKKTDTELKSVDEIFNLLVMNGINPSGGWRRGASLTYGDMAFTFWLVCINFLGIPGESPADNETAIDEIVKVFRYSGIERDKFFPTGLDLNVENIPFHKLNLIFKIIDAMKERRFKPIIIIIDPELPPIAPASEIFP